MKRVTVNDIAKYAGVAQSTVSKALAGYPGVRIGTKMKIKGAAEKLGYSANQLARGLAKKPINIGVIMTNVWPEHYKPIYSGIQKGLKTYNDFKLNVTYQYLSQLNNDKELEQHIDYFIDNKVDVVILCPVFNSNCGPALKKLDENGIKLILLGTDIDECNRIACIEVNAKKAGALVGEFADLIMHESRKIAVLIGNRIRKEHDEKQKGFAKSLKGTDCTIVGVYETQDIPEIASIITKKLLDDHPDLEAIYVATSNSIAVCETLEAIDKNKKIKIIATDVFKEMQPYLMNRRIVGAVYQDPEHMGIYAIRCVYEHFYQSKCQSKILISSKLVMRTNFDEYIYV